MVWRISRGGTVAVCSLVALCTTGGCSGCLDTDEFKDAPQDGGGAKDGGKGGTAQTGGSGGADAGAGGTVAGAGGTVGGTGGDSGGAGDIQGIQYINYITNKETLVKPDLSSTTITAFVDNSGTFSTFKGTGNTDGSFVIPGVPAGDYYIALNPLAQKAVYFVTDLRNIDLTYNKLGRSSAVAATKSTPLTIQISGMTPWQDGDLLDIFSAGAGLVAFSINESGTPALAPGATSIDFTVDMATLQTNFAGLLSSVDDLKVIHRRQVTLDGGTPYGVVQSVAILGSVNQVDGQAATVTGTFSEVQLTKSFTIDWRCTQFEALKSSIHPSAVFGSNFCSVFGLPGKLEYGLYADAPDVLEFGPPSGKDVMASLPFGFPFATTWSLTASFSTFFYVGYSLPSATSPTQMAAFLSALVDPTALPTPLVPSLSPATNVTVDGKNFWGNDALSSLTPLVAWQAPVTGTPTRYELVIYKLYTLGTATKQTPVAKIITPRLMVRIPPGLLEPGQSYAFRLRAAKYASVTPGLLGVGNSPSSSADVMSGIWTSP